MIGLPTDTARKTSPIGDIPVDWDVVELRDAVTVAEGLVDPKVEPYASMLHVGPENIEPRTGRLLRCRSAKEEGLISGKYLFRAGDIVYSKIRPYLRKAILADFEGLCSADAYPLTARPGYSTSFIHAVLLSDVFSEQATSQQDRTGIPKVNREQLRSIHIPRPSRVEEQKSIGQIATLLRKSIDAQAKLVTTLRGLKAATMAKLLSEGLRNEPLRDTELGPLPRNWSTAPIGSLVSRAQYGLSIRGSRAGAYAILRMNCQREGRVIMRDLQFVDVDAATFRAYRVRKGDLLFNRTNSIDLVGRTAICDEDSPAVFASYLVRLTPNERVVPAFLNHYLNLSSTQSALKGLATRAVGQSNISASKLKTFHAPISDDKAEEQEIVNIVDKLSDSIATAEKKRDAIGALFQSSLSRLMSGELRVAPLLEA